MKLILDQRLNNWGNQRLFEKIRSIFKLCLITGGFSICLFSILVSSSLNLIFSNIDIPLEEADINLDFSHYSKIEETSIQIPYHISNKGFLEVKRIILNINIEVSYTENLTFCEARRIIFSKQEVIGNCYPGKSISGVFDGDYHDLNMTALGNYLGDAYKFNGEEYLVQNQIIILFSRRFLFPIYTFRFKL